MTCIRSKFVPETFEVHEGDQINLHLTNVETVRDMTHGIAISKVGINLAVDPGQTAETTFTAGKPGTYWYYCTWFCSALHLEMRGRLLVKAAGEPLNEYIGPMAKQGAGASAPKGNAYE
jgi:nitrous-oxide reductase